MIRKRTIGTLTALGGTTVALALMLGQPAAKADDVTDLQANPELAKRVDQLAQVGLQKPQLPPGTAVGAGSFPRSFLIPGTDTSLLIGGYVKLDATDYLSGSGVNGNAATSLQGAPVISGLPLDLHGTGLYAAPFFNPHSRGNGAIQFTAKESRLRVETRTPTAWGEAGTVFEMDFYGCQSGGGAGDCNNLNHTSNANVPRLRLAYGTLGGFEAGQNWVPVLDLAAQPELFDFGGDFAFGYARAPQFGYKMPLPWLGATFFAGAVYPTTTLDTAAGQISTDTAGGTFGTVLPATGAGAVTGLAVNPTKSTFPDANFVLNWQQPWGHLQLGAVVQDLEMDDGALISKQYIGYGGGVSGDVKPLWFGWMKDDLTFGAYAGDGLDRYATDGTGTAPVGAAGLATNFGGPGLYGQAAVPGSVSPLGIVLPGVAAGPLTPAAAAMIRAATISVWSGQASYQHWWSPVLRSTASFSVVHWNVPTNLVGKSAATFNMNEELVSSHLNLIWSPVAFIDTGIEYTYGHRMTIFNAKGDENAIDLAFKVKF
jgi:hypothetical protein